jgi:hypothetical protein
LFYDSHHVFDSSLSQSAKILKDMNAKVLKKTKGDNPDATSKSVTKWLRTKIRGADHGSVEDIDSGEHLHTSTSVLPEHSIRARQTSIDV